MKRPHNNPIIRRGFAFFDLQGAVADNTVGNSLDIDKVSEALALWIKNARLQAGPTETAIFSATGGGFAGIDDFDVIYQRDETDEEYLVRVSALKTKSDTKAKKSKTKVVP